MFTPGARWARPAFIFQRWARFIILALSPLSTNKQNKRTYRLKALPGSPPPLPGNNRLAIQYRRQILLLAKRQKMLAALPIAPKAHRQNIGRKTRPWHLAAKRRGLPPRKTQHPLRNNQPPHAKHVGWLYNKTLSVRLKNRAYKGGFAICTKLPARFCRQGAAYGFPLRPKG